MNESLGVLHALTVALEPFTTAAAARLCSPHQTSCAPPAATNAGRTSRKSVTAGQSSHHGNVNGRSLTTNARCLLPSIQAKCHAC